VGLFAPSADKIRPHHVAVKPEERKKEEGRRKKEEGKSDSPYQQRSNMRMRQNGPPGHEAPLVMRER
jgi:hypothetical protein